jgi:hypothetical protein
LVLTLFIFYGVGGKKDSYVGSEAIKSSGFGKIPFWSNVANAVKAVSHTESRHALKATLSIWNFVTVEAVYEQAESRLS